MRYLLAILSLCWGALAWAQVAGQVDAIDGSVQLLDAQGKTRTLKVGDSVQVGETVVTGRDGELHLAMQDGGHLGIRSDTRMRIEQYKAEGGSDDSSIFNLLQGAMRSVTGWIGKHNPRNYSVRTPTATIGVRGTDHETRVIPEGSRDGEPGTYDKVHAGETELRTQHGTTRVRPRQAGFVGASARARPRLLDRVPDVFKPMRSEKRFDGLHDRVRSRLDNLRKERVKAVQQQRLEKRKTLENERLQKRQQQRQEKSQKIEQKRQRPDAQGGGFREDRRQQRETRREQQRASSAHERQRPREAGNDRRVVREQRREQGRARRDGGGGPSGR